MVPPRKTLELVKVKLVEVKDPKEKVHISKDRKSQRARSAGKLRGCTEVSVQLVSLQTVYQFKSILARFSSAL